MDALFQALDFLASGTGVLAVGGIGALMIVLWDWRIALAGLWLIQAGVMTLAVRIYGISAQWATAQLLIMLLCCTILAISAHQVGISRSMYQAGNWVLRLLALAIVFTCWQLVNPQVTLPGIGQGVVEYFGWLALCALLLLSMSNDPLFYAVALLLWFVPVQVVINILLPFPSIGAVMGILQLLLALACSYLILANRLGGVVERPILTDAVFPGELINGTQENETLDLATPTLGSILDSEIIDTRAGSRR